MSKYRIAFLLGNGYEESEFRVPYDRLLKADYGIDIVGVKAGAELVGKKGQDKTKVDVDVSEARQEHYDALIIPGGHSPDEVRADERVLKLVNEFERGGKTIAAICHGPQVLMSAGLVQNRTLTAWKTIQQDLRGMGAHVKDEPVVIDGNWITSRHPGDNEAFVDAIFAALREEPSMFDDEDARPAEKHPWVQEEGLVAAAPGKSPHDKH